MTVDESKLREVIADVRTLRERCGIEQLSTEPTVREIEQALMAIERKLGGMLPPIGGKFNISLDTVLKPR